MKKEILINGMRALGDNIHQRAVVREYLKQGYKVWLKTSWPSVYHDLPVVLLPRPEPVKMVARVYSQSLNIRRESGKYSKLKVPQELRTINVNIPREYSRIMPLVAAMSKHCDVPVGDYSLPVPREWQDSARTLLDDTSKPILLLRPFAIRKTQRLSVQRNPKQADYSELYRSIRDRFHVVSVALLIKGREWIEGDEEDTDQQFHDGQLDLPTMIGMFSIADVVLTTQGFASVIGTAVGTPTAVVYGGYEDGNSIQTDTPYLALEPVSPCRCFEIGHDCDKSMDVAANVERLALFSNKVLC